MNKEIKEILDNLKYYIDKNKKHEEEIEKGNYISEFYINYFESKQLYDYITNLQQENKTLNEETKMYAQLKDEYENIIDEAIKILIQDKSSASFNTAERMALNILQGSDKE